MLNVYGMSLSGNCHKVRMLLDHLGEPYKWHEISSIGGQTRTVQFLARNPNGKVPLLQLVDGSYLWESGAILQYLAHDSPLWPTDRLEQAHVLKWMFFEQNIHEVNIAEARFISRFLEEDHPRRSELPLKLEKGDKVLAVMEQHLAQHDYFVTDHCTIADIALFGYTHVADEGGFDMSRYPAIAAWIERVLTQPGFKSMRA